MKPEKCPRINKDQTIRTRGSLKSGFLPVFLLSLLILHTTLAAEKAGESPPVLKITPLLNWNGSTRGKEYNQLYGIEIQSISRSAHSPLPGGKREPAWKFLLESHYLAPATASETLSEKAPGRGTQGARASVEYRTPYFYLAAGSRYLPGPGGRFLSQAEFYSAWNDTPGPREMNPGFLKFAPGLGALIPGMFILENEKQAGIYWSTADDSALLAFHPRRELLHLTLAREFSPLAYPGHIYLDAGSVGEHRQGFFRYRAGRANEEDSLSLSGERRVEWDRSIGPHKQILRERTGKAGLLLARFTPASFLRLELGGEDRAGRGSRLGGLRLLSGQDDDALRFILRGRYYQSRYYDTAAAPYVDRGIAPGIRLGKKRAYLSVLVEARRRTAPVAELAWHIQNASLKVDLGAVYRRLKKTGDRPPAPAFLGNRNEQEAGGKFLDDDESAAFYLRLRNRYLYFYIKGSTRKKEPLTYGNFQFRIPMEF